MLGERLSAWTRTVSRMSTASFEYGFSVGRSAGPGAPARGARVSGDGLVQERLVEADQPASGLVGVGRRGRCQPAHQLADGGLDLAAKEQPAVAGERLADAVGELADDPEVHVADGVVRQHEEIGRVQVRVEVAEHVDLVEHVPVEMPHDPVQVVAGRGERGEVGRVPIALGDHDLDERDAIDEFGRQHARRRVVAMDAGDALVRIVPGVLVEEDGLARLDEVVELVGGPACEFVDDLAAARPPEQMRPVEQPRHRVHQMDVGLERLPDARPLDLDRDLLAAVQDGAVDLADRRGRE